MSLVQLERALARDHAVFATRGAVVAQCTAAELALAMHDTNVCADALVVDAPYSSRTHKGHGDGTETANRVADWARSGRKLGRGKTVAGELDRAQRLGAVRREIDYDAWGTKEVAAFVADFHEQCGWLISLTDHVLAKAWEAEQEAAGRYVFSPVACIESGSRVRMTGDGPPQWATWAVVSRPKSADFLAKWHALRHVHGLAPQGAYIVSSEKKPVTGGKPLTLMAKIVRDYTAPGQIVCDPCMGGGTTLVAALEEGRLAIGCEPNAERFDIACARIRAARVPLFAERVQREQLELGGVA